MEQSNSSSQNQLSCQPQRIKPEELQLTALHARKRAMAVRQVANASSLQASYNLGGWKSLFEEYRQQPQSANTISQEPEPSVYTLANSALCVETSSSANHSKNLSQSRNSSSGGEDLGTSVITAMPLCPSGRPEIDNAVVFGVIGGTVAAPRVSYITELVLTNEEILELSEALAPTEIFRIASTCKGHGCKHFEGNRCRLAMRIVEQLPSVVETLPACQIRTHCRWWQQEGKAACLRCPQVVTDNYYASDLLRQVAKP